MRALAYFGKEDLRFVDMPQGEVGVNDVLMKVKKVGICGTDLHIYHGGMNVQTPLVMGHEFVGEIVSVGSQVRHIRVGDRAVAEHVIGCGECSYCIMGRRNLCINPSVIGLHRPGALAELMVLPADLVYILPDDLSYDQGVLVEPLSIAVYAVQRSHLKVGYSVAVVGQGPIGLFVDAVAKQAGAQVIGIDVNESRLDYARIHGLVDQVINSKDGDIVLKIQEITGIDGVDVAFEAVGIEQTAQASFDVARRGGEVIMLGVFEHNVSVNLMQVVKKELVVSGSWTCLNVIPATIQLLRSDKINPDKFITHRYSFDDALRAFQEASSYSENRIKSVIEF